MDCGTDEYIDDVLCGGIFHFHHRADQIKLFGINKHMIDSPDTYTELNKCDMLCGNCHKMEHAKLGGNHKKHTNVSKAVI
jgi:hypothetical protein